MITEPKACSQFPKIMSFLKARLIRLYTKFIKITDFCQKWSSYLIFSHFSSTNWIEFYLQLQDVWRWPSSSPEFWKNKNRRVTIQYNKSRKLASAKVPGKMQSYSTGENNSETITWINIHQILNLIILTTIWIHQHYISEYHLVNKYTWH